MCVRGGGVEGDMSGNMEEVEPVSMALRRTSLI